MLNFVYWVGGISDPISAQKNLCDVFGKLAELENAETVIDVGSGLSSPAIYWTNLYKNLQVCCVNINYNQLCFSGPQKNIEFVNSTSTKLPFDDNSVTRVLALESPQHFKPIENFISECKRILKPSGILTMALPVTLSKSSVRNLGLLKFTWSSEHYDMKFIKKLVLSHGFTISDEQLIGDNVYDPLCDYYVKNRNMLKKSIKEKYPDFVEKILFKSMLKMKKASQEKIIDYAILKCTL